MADITLATEEGKIDLSRPTSTNLSAEQYFIVKHDSNEEIVLSGAADASLGVLQNAPDGSTNEVTAQVRVQGITKVKAAATVAFGDYITPDASGLAVVATAGQEFMAKALGSGDSGDLLAVLLMFGEVDTP